MKDYFEISLIDLQNATEWAIEFAEMALLIFEKKTITDDRARKAIEGAREFSESGKRTNTLRKLSMDAYRASREYNDPSVSMAANAASLTAALAFTHPFRDIKQAEHILGPVVYSILATGINNNDTENEKAKIEYAIDRANDSVWKLLKEFPEHEYHEDRVKKLFYSLDKGIRTKYESINRM